MPALSPVQRRDQAAVCAAAAVRRDQGPRLLHHHRGRPAPDVGRPVHQVREAVPLADLRRPRHHGLRPAGGDRRADRPSRSARHRRGGRSLDHDEHPGDVDGGAVPHAGEGLHPEQPLDGHGAAVAGTAAWRALFRELQRRAAGLREAGRRVRLDRPARDQAGRDGRHHQDHDRDSGTGDRRRRGRREGELLPDDPVGIGAQRDAAGSRRPESEPSVRRRHGAGVTKAQSLRHLDFAKKGEGVTQQIERHTISVMVDNEAGVLARVIGLFSGRGYNIESLTVAEVDAQHHFSRITVVTSGTPMIIEQIKNQLRRLVPVHRVTDLTVEGPSLERELILVKVKCTGEKRVESLRIADIFRARVVDSTIESFVFEMTGSTEKLTAFVNLMQPLGLVEVSRTGVVAISRGPEAI
ncbi:MAG: acetolactate synthase small subunit [Rhodospirillum sp.]|nr:acetolactate synthase small subunit [Rhodospirillum sp.]